MELPDKKLSSYYPDKAIRHGYWLLIPVLALAFYISFIPHLHYPYPVHIDEWVHLVYQQTVMGTGSLTFTEPFFGKLVFEMLPTLEAGYTIFWGAFQSISGLDWMIIYRYFPGIIFVITVFSVYILADRQGFGWEAALVTSLLPTTIGILGPAFLVPMAMGLLFMPLTLFVAFHFKNFRGYILLFVFSSSLMIIHAVTAVGIVIIVAPYVISNLKHDFRHSTGVATALGVPCLIPLIFISKEALGKFAHLLSTEPHYEFLSYPQIIQTYGYLPIALCLIGTFTLAMKGGKRNYGLVLGLAMLLTILAANYTWHLAIPTIIYDRGLTWAMLMVGIIAGAGLMGIRNFKLPEKLRLNKITRNAGYLLLTAVVGITLFWGIDERLDRDYYHMIDDNDYQAFVWIRDNIPDKYDKAILDPWKATTFTAVTGKTIFTRIHEYPLLNDENAYIFLEGGCIDIAFLRDNGISIVYTERECLNPDLIEVRDNVYLLRGAGAN